MRRRANNYRNPCELRTLIGRILKIDIVRPNEEAGLLEKRKYCYLCPSKLHRKTKYVCTECRKPICLECSKKLCKTYTDDTDILIDGHKCANIPVTPPAINEHVYKSKYYKLIVSSMSDKALLLYLNIVTGDVLLAKIALYTFVIYPHGLVETFVGKTCFRKNMYIKISCFQRDERHHD
nr:unnamed protein product [Callosobruchus analis]